MRSLFPRHPSQLPLPSLGASQAPKGTTPEAVHPWVVGARGPACPVPAPHVPGQAACIARDGGWCLGFSLQQLTLVASYAFAVRILVLPSL